MPEKPSDDEQARDQSTGPEPSKPSTPRKRFPLKFFLIASFIVAILGTAYVLNWLPHQFGIGGGTALDRTCGQLFARVPADNLFSSEALLRSVGRGPIDPSRVLFPHFDKSAGPRGDSEPLSTPAASDKVTAPAGADAESPDATESPGPAPTVETRSPSSQPSPSGGAQSKAGEAAADGASPAGTPPTTADSRRPEAPAQRFEDREAGTRTAQQPSRRGPKPAVTTTAAQTPPAVEPGQKDQFQLPGSLLVRIQGYTGTVPKWGLMVVLDDSASMAKKRRAWNPNRMEAASTLANKFPSILTPGSKFAVRDFLCNKQEGSSSKTKSGTCLSHMLYDWAEIPCNGLKEKLDQTHPAGSNNPCAAAAYSLARDFGSLPGLTPRIVLVTDGTAICPFRDVLSALEKQHGKDRISIDVFALGMHRKRQVGYGKLTQRTNGLFMKLDTPSDLDAVLARYGKTLKAPTMEKIEIRGGKGVLSVSPEEEITLPPGSYTVVLPAVAGISPSKRTIEEVTIKSGEATLVQVRVKKGRPVAKIGKK